jgi:tRNA A-37 threonylcarbamoyl transferase component Bud32
MPTPKLIGRLTRDTTELKSLSGRVRKLPDDLLRQASRRVEIMALVAAALWTLAPALGHLALYLTDPGDRRWAQFNIVDGIAATCVTTSIALYLYLRTGKRDAAFVMDLALVYMVVMAFGIGVLIHWGEPSFVPTDMKPMISWIGPIILITAAIVPANPWKMLIAGFVAASMDSLGMIVGQAAGLYDYGAFRNVLLMHYPNYLMLGVAVVISHVVARLGQQVTREREMGSYRMGELLGRGGMGEVYRATHRMLARPAAIKLIRPEVLASNDDSMAQTATARFRREAEAAARLRSPHTVELYDFGVTEEGTLYLVMELLEGINLELLVRQQGPQAAARVVHILRQVCESLEEAHSYGLVHRDIKPANIHLGRLGLREDFVKVLDFGLVRSTAGPSQESLTGAAGMTPGTPAYMAPEMAHDRTVDARADLYSLGCVAYYLLTGHLVFEGETPLQTILKHLQQSPEPPSRRTDRPIPAELETLVLACLAKRPDDRPGSAGELAERLAAVCLGSADPVRS